MLFRIIISILVVLVIGGLALMTYEEPKKSKRSTTVEEPAQPSLKIN